MSQQSTDHELGAAVTYKNPFYGKSGVIPGWRNVSKRSECKETGNLREPSSGKASGKDLLENNPAMNNSGNDK